jgi:single-strand DNA-binding protein
MNGTNQVILVGNVGNEPRCGIGGKGVRYASFTLATSERYKNKIGDNVEKTQWHNVTAFGFLAEVIENRVSKGTSLFVIGKLDYEKYTKDGVERTSAKIIAETLQVIERGQKQEAQAPRQASRGKPAAPKAPDFDDQEIPF